MDLHIGQASHQIPCNSRHILAKEAQRLALPLKERHLQLEGDRAEVRPQG
jgi:hypothetical protein